MQVEVVPIPVRYKSHVRGSVKLTMAPSKLIKCHTYAPANDECGFASHGLTCEIPELAMRIQRIVDAGIWSFERAMRVEAYAKAVCGIVPMVPFVLVREARDAGVIQFDSRKHLDSAPAQPWQLVI